MKPALLCSLALFIPNLVSAATLALESVPAHIGVGDTVQVTMRVESRASVNAFSGSLKYPSTMEPTAITDGDSVVSIWLEHPAVVGDTIRFAGLTPGGFSGTGGTLFSVIFRATKPGTAAFSVVDATVLRNDGEGSPEPTTTIPLSLFVATVATGGFVAPADTDPPELFSPQLGRDPALFGGRSYLVFTAADKGSGIDYYEVVETRAPRFLMGRGWVRTESPHTITDQRLTSDVYIKAVDRAGNERIALFPRAHLLRPYEWMLLGIVVVILAVLWYCRRTNLFHARYHTS